MEECRDFGHIPGLSWRRDGRTVVNPDRPVASLKNGDINLPNAIRARARGLHAARSPGGRHRDVARLHVRLQLLLDHRDARPELPHLRLLARAGRHHRRAGAWRADDLHRRRQHHARRPPVRGAVPGDRRCRVVRSRLLRAGDDVGDRGARRDARAADAAGGLPLRVPRHRERPVGRPHVPQGAREERAARGRPDDRQRVHRGDRASASSRHVRRRRPHRRQPGRHARMRSRRTSRSPGNTWTGPTSSTRRRTRARR